MKARHDNKPLAFVHQIGNSNTSQMGLKSEYLSFFIKKVLENVSAFKADKRRFTFRLQDVRSLTSVFPLHTPELKIELSYSQNSFCLAFSV